MNNINNKRYPICLSTDTIHTYETGISVTGIKLREVRALNRYESKCRVSNLATNHMYDIVTGLANKLVWAM